MKSRRVLLQLALTIAALCVAAVAYAHPPKAVELAWASGGTLTVTVEHAVNDPQKHFVNKIVVYANDRIAAQKEYQSQSNAEKFSDTFNLGNLPSGTVVKVEVSCIIMGSASSSLTIP